MAATSCATMIVTQSPAGGADVYTPWATPGLGRLTIQNIGTHDWLEVVGWRCVMDGYSMSGRQSREFGRALCRHAKNHKKTTQHSRHLALHAMAIWGAASSTAPSRRLHARPRSPRTLIAGLHPTGVVFPFLPRSESAGRRRPRRGNSASTQYSDTSGINRRRNEGLRLKAAYFNNDVTDQIGDGSSHGVRQSRCVSLCAWARAHSDLLPVPQELTPSPTSRRGTGRLTRPTVFSRVSAASFNNG